MNQGISLNSATFVFATLSLITSVLAEKAFAQDTYPSRPIEMVIPFTPGGATDFIARQMQTKMSQLLGQQIIITNKPGAATNIGNLYVARSKPDGYTLLVGSRNLTTNEALFTNLQYSPAKDLKPIIMTTNARVLMVINPALPIKNLREFIDYARRNPGLLNYASYGAGSTPHLAAEVFQKKTGIKLTHIPYAGNSPAVLATLRNETQVLFTTATSVTEHLSAGKLLALAQDGSHRTATYPSLATFKESGIEFNVGSWFGLLAPANTPEPIIAKLNEAARLALIETGTRERLAAQGWEVVGESPEEFRKFLELETILLSGVIKAADIRLD